MKTFVSVICLVTLSIVHTRQPGHATVSHSYVLRAWHIDGDPKTLLWSIDEDSSGDSTGTVEQSPGVLYPLLAAPPLRARISLFPAGTKLKFRGSVRGGVLSSAEEDKDWQQFVAFCESRHIVFDFFITTD